MDKINPKAISMYEYIAKNMPDSLYDKDIPSILQCIHNLEIDILINYSDNTAVDLANGRLNICTSQLIFRELHLKYVLLHEIGHIIDFERFPSLYHAVFLEKMNYEYNTEKQQLIELRAWEIAIKEIAPIFSISFNSIFKENCMKALKSYNIDNYIIDSFVNQMEISK